MLQPARRLRFWQRSVGPRILRSVTSRRPSWNLTMSTTFLRRLAIVLTIPLALLAPARGDDRESAAAVIRVCMQPFVDSGEISGAVTVVGRKDAIVSYETIGLPDLETRTPIAKDPILRPQIGIASCM